MKSTTKKILLALYTPTQDDFFKLSQSAIELLVPELSQEGRRSLLYLLEKKGYIQTLKVQKQTFFLSTEKARRVINGLFPALLSSDQGTNHQWTVIAFSSAPKGDPQFRYLRSKLIQEGALGVARGVYIFGTTLSNATTHVIETLYNEHVLVFTVDRWLFGSERPIISKHFHLSETIEAYSSISSELDALLGIFDVKKRLTDKNKDDLCKIYVRWFETISEDSGLANRYFPQDYSGIAILLSIQTLLLHI